MPRRARVVIADVPHHVTQRGNNRQQVFLSPDDHYRYLQLLRGHADRCGLRILGYCLMTNHVHLIAVPEKGESLAQALGRAHSEYALALNRAAGRSGHLWQNRFFSCPMGPSHLLAALRYVELNPVRAGLVTTAVEWPWSSARAHVRPIASDGVLCSGWIEHFGQWNYEEWAEILEAGSPDGECESVRRATMAGEPFGSRDFVAELERRVGKNLRVRERGRPRKEPESATGRGVQGCFFTAADV